MHIELGTGRNVIVFCNSEGSFEINTMLSRIATAYSTMLCMGYAEIDSVYRSSRIVLTDAAFHGMSIKVNITTRPYGIYAKHAAYDRQIARAIQAMTRLPVFCGNRSDANAEIGLSGIDITTEGYVLLKDAMLALPYYLF